MSDSRPNERADFSPLQFGTRTLLVGTAACAVLFLILRHVSALWGATLVWFLVMVAVHVAANVRGSHGHGAAPRDPDHDDAPLYQQPQRIRYAPATRLRDSKGFSRVLLAVTLSCAALGLIGGTAALLLATAAGAGGIALGGLSAAVLSGFLGFVACSFTMVATGAFQEAARSANRAHPRPGELP